MRRWRGPCFRLALGLAAALAVPALARAQSADNVLVVINENSPVSVQVGEYYARQRAIAQDHVVRIKTANTDGIDRALFDRDIQAPIGQWLLKHSLQDRVLYLVLTKGVPLRVNGTDGLGGTVASVDSELTLLYRRLVGEAPPVVGRVDNPYFLGSGDPYGAKPFTRFTSDIYLVTRLDGFTVDDVLKLIDRGLRPVKQGKIVLDEKATLIDRGGDQWLQETSDRLRLHGEGDWVLLEPSKAVATTSDPVLGYFSWGSNDPANKRRHFGLTFADGAIGGMFVSTDGRTFAEPPANWVPGGSIGGFGSQSLAGDLIHDGITGVSANVAEPFLDAIVRPQILIPAYLNGMNLAEAYYLAMPYLSWQTVIVGDPLCAPFRTKTLAAEDIAKPLDEVTELPGLFSDRKLARVETNTGNIQAIKLTMRADVELGRDNQAEAMKALARAVELDATLLPAQLSLAQLYEATGDYPKAEDGYRKILALDPTNVIALNNLAYALATRDHKLDEALPLAQQAYKIASLPTVADTVGWIHHLMGEESIAAALLEVAVKGDPNNVELLVHSAIVHLAVNDKVTARKNLAAADKLDPKLDDRPEVKELRAKLKDGGSGPIAERGRQFMEQPVFQLLEQPVFQMLEQPVFRPADPSQTGDAGLKTGCSSIDEKLTSASAFQVPVVPGVPVVPVVPVPVC